MDAEANIGIVSAGTINPRVSIIQLCKQRESIAATPDAPVF